MTLDTYLKSRPDRCSGCGYHPAHQGCRCETDEWSLFLAAVRQAASAAADGKVHQHLVRPLIRGRIAPKHIGALYRRAKSEGLLVQVGKEPSRDVAGRNTHHDSPVYELREAS